MTAPPRQARRSLLVPGLFTVTAFVVLVSLGTWQLERKAWKEALIRTVTERIAAAPEPLPSREVSMRLDPAEAEFRRVAFSAEFLHDKEALVYTTGSALRADVSGPGYWVFTPARLPDGSLLVVNRGFVPEGRQNPGTRGEGQVPGRVDIVGALRWPETPGWFAPKGDVAHNLWFARDHLAIAAAKNWSPVAPFYVEQEAPPAPGGLPRVGKIEPKLPDNHLQYAITWYGLALVLAGVFAFWLRARARGGV
jgi:surfeit locus 1 family protein